jgi:pyruvate/2-oxoglutarate dehydrogenase complex dihydrolipoamide dehydrogenase (E3) component
MLWEFFNSRVSYLFLRLDNERANITGKTQGFVKVLVCKSHRTFIGLHIVGPEAISQI